jgi:hypothetical protein
MTQAPDGTMWSASLNGELIAWDPTRLQRIGEVR